MIDESKESMYGRLQCDHCYESGQKFLVSVKVEVDYGQHPSDLPHEDQQWCGPCVMDPTRA